MKVTSYYPVIMAEDVAATAAFYQGHFAFEAMYTSEWYVHLTSRSQNSVNLAIVTASHDTVPEGFRKPVGGLLLNFEVEDVDAEHARLVADGVCPVFELRSEAFGQRHFMVADPAGTLIDIITPIPPSAEFAANYAPEALAR